MLRLQDKDMKGIRRVFSPALAKGVLMLRPHYWIACFSRVTVHVTFPDAGPSSP